MDIPGGYAQVNLQFTGTNLPNGADVTFGVRNDNGLSATSIAGIIANSMTAQTMSAIWSADATLSNIHVKKGPNDTGAFADLAQSLVGTGGSTSLPGNTCLIVNKLTDFGGRRGRGRMFWPSLSDGAVGDDCNLTSAFNTAMLSLMGSWLGYLNTQTVPMYLLHSDNSFAIFPYQVVSLFPRLRVGTQRRRTRL